MPPGGAYWRSGIAIGGYEPLLGFGSIMFRNGATRPPVEEMECAGLTDGVLDVTDLCRQLGETSSVASTGRCKTCMLCKVNPQTII